MAFNQVRLGDYFRFEKGLGYKGEFLVEESNVGLVGIDSQVPGGGYKENSEKPYSGPYRPEHVVDSGDVIVAATDITQDGSVLGSTLMIPESTNYETLIYSGDVMKAIPIKPDEFGLEYFYNLFRVEKYRKKVAYGDTGTTVRRLSEEGICEQSVPLPDLPTQVAINDIISLIDQQFANNKALTRNLESLAQAVFKSWFIDFDPVKAKMVGKKPAGMDAATAGLFPDSMDETEHGLVPSGWEWKTIGEIAHVIDCLHSKKPKLLSGGHPYLQLDTISDSGVLFFENAGCISKEDYKKWTSRIEVEGGDCLITNVGRVGAVSQVPKHFKAAIGRNITAIRPKNSKLHQSFLIIALLSDFMKREISKNTDSGTILEALNVKNIPGLLIPGPSSALLLEFAKVCDPIQSQIQELHKMDVNLRKIRDLSLPGLISGDLQIPKLVSS